LYTKVTKQTRNAGMARIYPDQMEWLAIGIDDILEQLNQELAA